MELFWYQTQCKICNTILEHTFKPDGANYAEKYHHFVNSIAPSRFIADYVHKNCNTCNSTTKQEVLHFAPAYTGIE